MTVVYDAGVLVAADRNDRAAWADHRVRLELGLCPVVTAPVVGQVARSSRQVQLRRFLSGCEVVAFADEDSYEVGSMLAKSELSDVVDAHVVLTAARRRSIVVTSDPGDIKLLASTLAHRVTVSAI